MAVNIVLGGEIRVLRFASVRCSISFIHDGNIRAVQSVRDAVNRRRQVFSRIYMW
jgi:ABC-type taurine transport system ATPase subunit